MTTQSCANCGKHEGTEVWAGHLDGLNASRMRSMLPKWCEGCVLEAQLEHARTESARLIGRIPVLERAIAELAALRREV